MNRLSGQRWPRWWGGFAPNRAPCPFCGVPMRRTLRMRISGGLSPDHATRHHILPRRWGGRDTAENRIWCCLKCNGALAPLNECPAALACMYALSGSLHKRDLLRTIRHYWPPSARL